MVNTNLEKFTQVHEAVGTDSLMDTKYIFKNARPKSDCPPYLHSIKNHSMQVVQFLNDGHTLDELEGTYHTYIASKNVYIVNYDQIRSNKNDLLTRQCRSLILRKNTQWELIANSFVRFFNYGENADETKRIQENIQQCTILEKKDGSLITVTHFDNEWHVFTRGSDADNNPFRGMVPHDSKETFGQKVRQFLSLDRLHTQRTYVFELCVPGSHITQYFQEHISLLTVLENGTELSPDVVTAMAMEHKWDRPKSYHFESVDDMFATLAQTPHDFEGFVIQFQNIRVKLKKDTYKMYHLMAGTSVTTQSLMRVCLLNEIDEFLTIQCLQKFKSNLQPIQEFVTSKLLDIQAVYNEHKSKPAKEYASIVTKHPFKSILFQLYRGHVTFDVPQHVDKWVKAMADVYDKQG